MQRLIEEHPAVAALGSKIDGLAAEQKEAEAAAQAEWNTYQETLKLAAVEGLPLPEPPSSNLGAIDTAFRQRRDVLERLKREAVAEHADELLAAFVEEQDRLLVEGGKVLAELDGVVRSLDALMGGVGQVEQMRTQVTHRPSEVPFYGGGNRMRYKVNLIGVVHALRLGKRFVGDPVVALPQVRDAVLTDDIPEHLRPAPTAAPDDGPNVVTGRER
jgi:hypothetical protein